MTITLRKHLKVLEKKTATIHDEKTKHLIGVRSSRGTRAENEDWYRCVTLQLPDGDASRVMTREANRAYFGIFDGHGGPIVSDWLATRLHEKIETVSLDDLPDISLRCGPIVATSVGFPFQLCYEIEWTNTVCLYYHLLPPPNHAPIYLLNND
ncbi:unnamed protein product [Absidia cylindrospora]